MGYNGSMSILSVDKLTKSFGEKRAITEVSFDITPGSITGFLGPNGAGKSTTMNIIMGFIKPNAGEVRVFGQPVVVSSPKTRQNIGFLSNSSQLDRNLTVAQGIEYYGNVGGKYEPGYAHELAKRLSLDISQKIGGLSTGSYQKTALVIALMHKPKLLILDEPTNGLDPLVQAEFNKIIRDFKNAGSTVFISSHILSEVQGLCDEFIFIKKGRIEAQLKRADLLKETSQVITVNTTDKNHQKVVKYLSENKVAHSIDSPGLDEIFMKYYGDDSA